jgi:hypothetical protein
MNILRDYITEASRLDKLSMKYNDPTGMQHYVDIENQKKASPLMQTDKQTVTDSRTVASIKHKCDCCGCDLSYSAELHCATCHRELWTPALDEVHVS